MASAQKKEKKKLPTPYTYLPLPEEEHVISHPPGKTTYPPLFLPCLRSPSPIMAPGYNQCVVHVPKSDMELLQFLAATDHDIFSCVVFLNLHSLSTINESCKKPTQT